MTRRHIPTLFQTPYIFAILLVVFVVSIYFLMNPKIKNEFNSSCILTQSEPVLFSDMNDKNIKYFENILKKNRPLKVIIYSRDEFKQYNLETYRLSFEEKVGGPDAKYIKLKEVEQNSAGTHFAIVYMDDGYFKLRTFGETTRDEEEIKETELDINKELGLNNYTIPIHNFPDPFITCCFCNEEWIYVNLFH